MSRALSIFVWISAAVGAGACLAPPPDVVEDAGPPDAEPPIDMMVDIDAGPDAMPDAIPDAGLTPAMLSVSAPAHDFDDVTVGASSDAAELIVRNNGQQTSGVIAVSISGAQAADFALATGGDCAGAPLPPNTNCSVFVEFAPDAAGPRSAQLDISADPGGTLMVDLDGNGLTAGDLELVTAASLAFGPIEITAQSTTQTITVRNGGETATGNLTTILGDDDNYTITSDGCDGLPLGPSNQCSVVVRFRPTTVGSLPTQLSIRESPTVGVSTGLTGTGTARIAVSKTGSGTISSDPAGLSCGTGCNTQSASFEETPVTLTATPAVGYVFSGWTDACAPANPSNVCTVELSTPLTTTAVTFTQVFPLDVTVTGSGTVTSVPTGISCGDGATDCSETYNVNTPVTLTATPAAGWTVYSWSGTGTSCPAGTTVCATTMNQMRNVTVELRRQWLVMVMVGGSGAANGSVTGGTISCPGACSMYAFDGTSVTLTESPGTQGGAAQSRFAGWSGACTGSATQCTFTVSADTTAMASFTQQYRLAVSLAGTGTGTVTSAPNSCSSGTCNWYYDTGSMPSLSTTNGAASLFSGYSGDCSGTSCMPTMTAARAVTATFGTARHLNVAVTGSGTVTSAPSGINCGADCDEDYLHDTDVVLTATPSAGWEVYAWGGTGGTCGAGLQTCPVDMTTARNVTVEFRRQWTVTVNTSGSGAGTVTGGTISCTTPMTGCTMSVFDGSSLTLTQSQGTQGGASQSRFGGWGGACSGTGTTCALTNITANQTVTASSILQYRLAVTITGAGSLGHGGNTCGSGTCNWYYDTGANAAPVATPNAGALFLGFGGDCGGTACSLTMNTAHAVTATFGTARHLNVAVTGSGTVTSAPSGINCGADCDEDYLHDTDVVLTATPSAGWEVYAWGGTGGTCGAGLQTCPVDMTTARNVTVEFRRQWTVTVNTSGSGAGTVTGGTISCTTPMTGCTMSVFDGSSLTLTQSQGTQGGASQSRFGGWGGACSGTGTTCALTNITANQTVTASSILQYRLAVTIGGTGGGTVTQSTNTCSTGTCNWYYDTGTTPTLTATANGASWFDGYSGDCTGASCMPAMTAARAVATDFRLMACTPNVETCNDATDDYQRCGPTGLIEEAFHCPINECSSTSEKCLDVQPLDDGTYDLYPYLAMSETGPAYAFVGSSTINTSTGDVCIGTSACVTPPSAVVNGVRVFWLNSLSVEGVLKVSGSNAIALLVDGAVTVTGTIDVSADGSTPGPGARTDAAGCAGSAGNTNSSGSAGAGGGGAARGQFGRSGGNASGYTPGGGGSVDTSPFPLRGGCKGGAASGTMMSSLGGGGGGALQIVSRTSISITGSGVIDASGGGGRNGNSGGIDHPGGGGGSGGLIVLEAPTVVVADASVVLSTKGGAGAGAGAGQASAQGQDGGTAAAVAAGGSSGSLPVGGNGGSAVFGVSSTQPTDGGGSTSAADGAGGGAGAGVLRVATRNGMFAATGGASLRSTGSVATLTVIDMP